MKKLDFTKIASFTGLLQQVKEQQFADFQQRLEHLKASWIEHFDTRSLASEFTQDHSYNRTSTTASGIDARALSATALDFDDSDDVVDADWDLHSYAQDKEVLFTFDPEDPQTWNVVAQNSNDTLVVEQLQQEQQQQLAILYLLCNLNDVVLRYLLGKATITNAKVATKLASDASEITATTATTQEPRLVNPATLVDKALVKAFLANAASDSRPNFTSAEELVDFVAPVLQELAIEPMRSANYLRLVSYQQQLQLLAPTVALAQDDLLAMHGGFAELSITTQLTEVADLAQLMLQAQQLQQDVKNSITSQTLEQEAQLLQAVVPATLLEQAQQLLEPYTQVVTQCFTELLPARLPQRLVDDVNRWSQSLPVDFFNAAEVATKLLDKSQDKSQDKSPAKEPSREEVKAQIFEKDGSLSEALVIAQGDFVHSLNQDYGFSGYSFSATASAELSTVASDAKVAVNGNAVATVTPALDAPAVINFGAISKGEQQCYSSLVAKLATTPAALEQQVNSDPTSKLAQQSQSTELAARLLAGFVNYAGLLGITALNQQDLTHAGRIYQPDNLEVVEQLVDLLARNKHIESYWSDYFKANAQALMHKHLARLRARTVTAELPQQLPAGLAGIKLDYVPNFTFRNTKAHLNALLTSIELIPDLLASNPRLVNHLNELYAGVADMDASKASLALLQQQVKVPFSPAYGYELLLQQALADNLAANDPAWEQSSQVNADAQDVAQQQSQQKADQDLDSKVSTVGFGDTGVVAGVFGAIEGEAGLTSTQLWRQLLAQRNVPGALLYQSTTQQQLLGNFGFDDGAAALARGAFTTTQTSAMQTVDATRNSSNDASLTAVDSFGQSNYIGYIFGRSHQMVRPLAKVILEQLAQQVKLSAYQLFLLEPVLASSLQQSFFADLLTQPYAVYKPQLISSLFEPLCDPNSQAIDAMSGGLRRATLVADFTDRTMAQLEQAQAQEQEEDKRVLTKVLATLRQRQPNSPLLAKYAHLVDIYAKAAKSVTGSDYYRNNDQNHLEVGGKVPDDDILEVATSMVGMPIERNQPLAQQSLRDQSNAFLTELFNETDIRKLFSKAEVLSLLSANKHSRLAQVIYRRHHHSYLTASAANDYPFNHLATNQGKYDNYPDNVIQRLLRNRLDHSSFLTYNRNYQEPSQDPNVTQDGFKGRAGNQGASNQQGGASQQQGAGNNGQDGAKHPRFYEEDKVLAAGQISLFPHVPYYDPQDSLSAVEMAREYVFNNLVFYGRSFFTETNKHQHKFIQQHNLQLDASNPELDTPVATRVALKSLQELATSSQKLAISKLNPLSGNPITAAKAGAVRQVQPYGANHFELDYSRISGHVLLQSLVADKVTTTIGVVPPSATIPLAKATGQLAEYGFELLAGREMPSHYYLQGHLKQANHPQGGFYDEEKYFAQLPQDAYAMLDKAYGMNSYYQEFVDAFTELFGADFSPRGAKNLTAVDNSLRQQFSLELESLIAKLFKSTTNLRSLKEFNFINLEDGSFRSDLFEKRHLKRQIFGDLTVNNGADSDAVGASSDAVGTSAGNITDALVANGVSSGAVDAADAASSGQQDETLQKDTSWLTDFEKLKEQRLRVRAIYGSDVENFEREFLQLAFNTSAVAVQNQMLEAMAQGMKRRQDNPTLRKLTQANKMLGLTLRMIQYNLFQPLAVASEVDTSDIFEPYPMHEATAYLDMTESPMASLLNGQSFNDYRNFVTDQYFDSLVVAHGLNGEVAQNWLYDLQRQAHHLYNKANILLESSGYALTDGEVLARAGVTAASDATLASETAGATGAGGITGAGGAGGADASGDSQAGANATLQALVLEKPLWSRYQFNQASLDAALFFARNSKYYFEAPRLITEPQQLTSFRQLLGQDIKQMLTRLMLAQVLGQVEPQFILEQLSSQDRATQATSQACEPATTGASFYQRLTQAKLTEYEAMLVAQDKALAYLAGMKNLVMPTTADNLVLAVEIPTIAQEAVALYLFYPQALAWLFNWQQDADFTVGLSYEQSKRLEIYRGVISQLTVNQPLRQVFIDTLQRLDLAVNKATPQAANKDLALELQPQLQLVNQVALDNYLEAEGNPNFSELPSNLSASYLMHPSNSGSVIEYLQEAYNRATDSSVGIMATLVQELGLEVNVAQQLLETPTLTYLSNFLSRIALHPEFSSYATQLKELLTQAQQLVAQEITNLWQQEHGKKDYYHLLLQAPNLIQQVARSVRRVTQLILKEQQARHVSADATTGASSDGDCGNAILEAKLPTALALQLAVTYASQSQDQALANLRQFMALVAGQGYQEPKIVAQVDTNLGNDSVVASASGDASTSGVTDSSASSVTTGDTRARLDASLADLLAASGSTWLTDTEPANAVMVAANETFVYNLYQWLHQITTQAPVASANLAQEIGITATDYRVTTILAKLYKQQLLALVQPSYNATLAGNGTFAADASVADVNAIVPQGVDQVTQQATTSKASKASKATTEATTATVGNGKVKAKAKASTAQQATTTRTSSAANQEAVATLAFETKLKQALAQEPSLQAMREVALKLTPEDIVQLEKQVRQQQLTKEELILIVQLFVKAVQNLFQAEYLHPINQQWRILTQNYLWSVDPSWQVNKLTSKIKELQVKLENQAGKMKFENFAQMVQFVMSADQLDHGQTVHDANGLFVRAFHNVVARRLVALREQQDSNGKS